MRRYFSTVLLILPLLLTLIPPHAVQAAPPTTLSVTLEDLGYRDLTLQGMYGSATVWIPFAGDWAFETPAQMTVVYTASTLLTPRSTLTVLANDLEVASVRLEADGNLHRFTFSIPVERLQGKGLTLRFRAYLRLTDETCEETNNPAQWVRILSESQLVLHPVPKISSPDLKDLAATMVVAPADYAGPAPALLFLLPDKPTAEEMTTAAQVARRLAAASGREPEIVVRTASTFAPERAPDANLVLIGTPDRQPWLQHWRQHLPYPLLEGTFADAKGQPVPPEDGAVMVFAAPWDPARWVLVVSGGNAEGLQRAAMAFADEATFSWLSGEGIFIHEPLSVPPPTPPRPWSTEITSFAQLGAGDRRVNGAGIHQEYFYFHRPPGWVFDKGSQLVLRFTTSTALSSREAYIAVFLNEVPIGTVRTGPDFPITEAVFDLPVDRINRTLTGERPINFTLRLEVANYLLEANCEQIHPEAAWTIIRGDSYFVTPHVYDALPDLQAYPYPFVGTETTGPTAIIVPPEPNERDLALALSLAAQLGRYAPAPFTLQILPGDQATPETAGDAHLIVLGSRARQPLLQTMLDVLGAIPGYRGEAGLYRALGNAYQGLLREGPSPWNDQRIALLAFGETDAGYERAVQALLQQVPPVQEPGSVALVNEHGETKVLFRPAENAPQPQPGQVNREPLLPSPRPWMVVTAIIVLTALAIWGIILWARWRYGRTEQEE